ncbi:MAG: tripartite tricarboxylate transporter substrate binding protein [Betaproteobacteria bacterium]|nr:tripartite tricarboxylate transporter substrate binding protein [Betaproteobacteria bacterium]
MLKALLVAGALLAGSLPAWAQPYPNRPLRIVVPFPPGGGTDIGTRIVAQKLQEAWGQAVIVENKPGAAGIVGTELTAKSAPDGYTFMMGNIGTHAINVSLYKKLAYDPVRDFAPVSMVADLPLLLLVHPSVPANSVKELIALAKSQPGKLNFSSSGAGGSMHVAAELFKSMTGVDMVHIPYKGGAPAVADLLSGQVALSFSTVLETIQHVKAGKVRALAVTNDHRSIALPDLPTIAEAGLPGYQSISWLALFAPAGTPKDIVNKVSAESVRILKLPDVKERLLAQGAEPIGSTPEQLAAILATDIAKYAKVIRESGYKPE